MVDMLVESSNNVAMILKFFDMFLKLKDLTSSDTFKEYDPDGKGKVSFMNSHWADLRNVLSSSCSVVQKCHDWVYRCHLQKRLL